MSEKGQKPISLALQGGGAHGAFEWGVIDRLLEDGRVTIKAVTGASAAMNGAVLAAGLMAGGADAGRARLEAFWRATSGPNICRRLDRARRDGDSRPSRSL